MEEYPKILCLHGYRQNATKFRSQTGALRKILKNHASFHFISAPHLVPDSEKSEEEKNDDQRSWWFTKETSFHSKDETDDHFGFRESVQLIEETFDKEGPFQGILGFSQGAALVALLSAMKVKGEFLPDFKFVIIVSGFKSMCKPHLSFYDNPINIPSLHVIGETDRIIQKEMSETLSNIFTSADILHHSGGHFVPGKSSFKKNYIDFITKQIQEIKVS